MDAMRKYAHEEEKRTRKLKRLALKCGIDAEKARQGLIKANEDAYHALRNHPALQAQIKRN